MDKLRFKISTKDNGAVACDAATAADLIRGYMRRALGASGAEAAACAVKAWGEKTAEDGDAFEGDGFTVTAFAPRRSPSSTPLK